MRYYACAADHKRLLEPPFKVIRHEPGYGVLFSFGEEGIATLREILNDVAVSARRGDDGSVCKMILLWDDSLDYYGLTASGFEPLGEKTRPDWRRGIIRSYRKYGRRRAKARRFCERDTATCAKISQPLVDKGRVSLLWFPFYRHYRYAKPGGDSQFRFRFRRARGKKPLPLFIFLHGAGSMGYNGIMSMIELSPVWLGLKKTRQKCHVLVPQLPLRSDGYDDDAWSQSLGEVIGWIAGTTGNLDFSRICLYGVSMGGAGAIAECWRHPERYAAAVALVRVEELYRKSAARELEDCFDRLTLEETVPVLAKTPLWLGYSDNERQMNEPLYNALKEAGADVRDTRIDTFGHGMPILFSPFQPWAKWLFNHKS